MPHKPIGCATAPKRCCPNTGMVLAVVAIACIVAYVRSLDIPLIADDFPNIAQSLTWGAPEGLGILLRDAQFRLRATSYWTMFALCQVGELTPWIYHAASLAIHIVNAWLVFAVASTWDRTRAAALWAAFFFAIHEGHQEAIMWFSAVNELLMFCFGMASLWFWLRRKDAISVVLFALALLSKESAVVLLPLFLLCDPERWKRLVPHAVLAALAVGSIAQSHANSFRFSDGSFSLAAPFWLTWPRSLARLLWIWGWVAGAAIWFTRNADARRLVLWCAAWMGIALVPYSFLTYSTQIPSRQTYLASAGLALLVGLAAARLDWGRWAAVAAAVLLLHNVGYLWTKKHEQFVERAAPTQQLILFAERTRGHIWVRCFPLPRIVADEAVRLGAGRPIGTLVWAQENGASEFCYQEKR